MKVSRFRYRGLPVLTVLAALLLAPAMLATPARAEFSKDEIKMGQEAAKEVEKDSKVVTDKAIVDRVNTIGQALAKVCGDPKAEFTFKVLDEKEVNAFALPGGFVYVYKGLLDKVESDDELAGVLAHEMTHALHHHTQKILKKQRPWDLASMGIILAGVFSGKDVSGLAQGVNLLNVAKINGYTIDLEKDADAGGMDIMLKSKYNPVGMYTFMERLARTEAHSGSSSVDQGIFRTHPYSADRAAALRARLEKAGVDINPRLVTKSVRVMAQPVKDKDEAVLIMDDKPLLTLAPDGKASALDRAKAIAQQFNDLLDKNLRYREVYVAKDGTEVVARDTTLIRVSDADARLAGASRTAVAADTAKSIQNVLWGEYLRWNS